MSPTRPPCPSTLRGRLIITGAVVLSAWLSRLVPSPCIDRSALSEMAGGAPLDAALSSGPFSLGLTPFIIAFVLVEVAVLIFRNGSRHGNPRARRRMYIAASLLGVVICIAQGWGQALLVESADHMLPGGVTVPGPGMYFRVFFALTVTGGSLLWFACAWLIDRRGVGSGFALLILVPLISGVPNALADILSWVVQGSVSPIGILFFAAATTLLLGGAIWILVQRGPGRNGALPICVPTCGTIPLELSIVLLMFPATVYNLTNHQVAATLQQALLPGRALSTAVQIFFIALCVPLVSVLFYRRRREHLRIPHVKIAWRRAVIESAMLLIGGLLLRAFLGHLPGGSMRSELPSVLVSLFIAALVLDFVMELRARWRAQDGEDLIVLDEHQDLADALDARAAYEKAGQGIVIQGLYYRSLSYFFAPFVPLRILGRPTPGSGSILVAAKKDDATAFPDRITDSSPSAARRGRRP